MTYCNPLDVFLYNGEIVQCVKRDRATANLLVIATGLEIEVDIASQRFQVTAQPVRTLKSNFDGIVSVEEIINTVCEHFNLPTAFLTGKCRKVEYVDPRHIAIFLCTKFTGNNLKYIGARFGARDHTTVIHARNKINNMIFSNDPICDDLQDIESALWMKHNSATTPISVAI